MAQKYTAPRLYFRDSWFEIHDRLKTLEDCKAFMHLIRDSYEGNPIDEDSMSDVVASHIPDVQRCFNFDEREKERKNAGEPCAYTTRNAHNYAHDKVSKAYKVSEANKVCKAIKEMGEKIQTSSSSSSPIAREEEERGNSSFISENDIEKVFNYWNDSIDKRGVKLVKLQPEDLSPELKSDVAKRLREFKAEGLKAAIDNAVNSEFMNETARMAPFDFKRFISYDNFRKILRNGFDKKVKSGQRRADFNIVTEDMVTNGIFTFNT